MYETVLNMVLCLKTKCTKLRRTVPQMASISGSCTFCLWYCYFIANFQSPYLMVLDLHMHHPPISYRMCWHIKLLQVHPTWELLNSSRIKKKASLHSSALDSDIIGWLFCAVQENLSALFCSSWSSTSCQQLFSVGEPDPIANGNRYILRQPSPHISMTSFWSS